VESGPGLAGRPGYGLIGQVISCGQAGPILSHDGHATGGTVGDVDWKSLSQAINQFDEYRFCRLCLRLVSVTVSVPENLGGITPEGASEWGALVPVAGTLRLAGLADSFHVEPAVASRFTSHEVIALTENGIAPGKEEKVRVEVASGFQLLFSEGRLCGWILNDPEYRIVAHHGWASRYSRDAGLGRVLCKYMNLVSDPGNSDLLLDGDPGLRRSLLAMMESLRMEDGAVDRRAIMLECIGDTMENWFSDLGRPRLGCGAGQRGAAGEKPAARDCPLRG
jgi:hypothetical protein